jgi:uncharacterized protein (TIGR02284 family)
MMSDQDHTIKAIEGLIEICRDGQEGYRNGAEHAKDQQVREFLNTVSLERGKFAGDLENEAIRLGKSDVTRSGNTLGAIHRGWTDLKANLGGGDDSILSSMETGDKYAQDHYAKYIEDKQIPGDLIGVIRNQSQAIVGTLERVKAMRARKAA